jgi:hypothetical protein
MPTGRVPAFRPLKKPVTPKGCHGLFLSSGAGSRTRGGYQLVGPVSTFDSMVACTVLLTAERML